MGLAEHIHATRKNGQLITSNKLFELTLEGVYNYLKATHDKDKIDFSVVYWMPFKKNQKKYLKMYGFRLPEGNIAKSKQRVVPEDDFKFKVCQCFQKMESIASPSVLSDFHEKIWHYFDQNQKKFKRGMESAIQIPVYFMHLGVKVPKGVLSIDSSRPNLFLNEEMSLVKEELLHYLVNLCLATSLYEKGV